MTIRNLSLCTGVLLSVLAIRCADAFAGSHDRAHHPADSAKDLHYIFKNGQEGYTCYRIPALVRTNRGTLLAFAEGRKKGCSDTGDIDLVVKRSDDDGVTWSALQVVWNDGENTCGNPAPVVERETGKIILLSTWNLGSDHEKEIINGESQDTRRVFFTASTDDGNTWTPARQITEAVKKPDWTWYATGPCAGIQLTKGPRKGRLVIPCDHIMAKTGTNFSHIIYSDDRGETWQLGGTVPTEGMNESTAAELSDGRLMINMRNADRAIKRRQVAVSRDGGNTWQPAKQDSTLVEPVCQASLISHRWPGRKKHYLVFSNPASTKRENLTVRLSRNDGKTWIAAQVLYPGPAAYSDLCSMPDGRIGCLYEAGIRRPYEGIAFRMVTF